MKPFLINRFVFLMVTDPLETEVWKTLEIRGKIVGFSSFGKFQDSNGIKKTVTPSKGGYCSVQIAYKQFQFHNLMCTAFHGEKPSKDHVADHIDLNPTNNRPDNLRWLTHKKIYKRVVASIKIGNPKRRNKAFQSLDASINPRMSGSCTRV